LTLEGEEAAAAVPGPGCPGADASTPGQGGHAPRADAPQAAETRRLYARDWAAFEAWCATWERTPLPASPGTAAAYLALLARRFAPGALARHAAALNDRHRRAGHPAPGDDPVVQAVLQAARTAHRAKPDAAPPARLPSRRAVPPGPAQLARMAARCPGDLAGLRDRALLLLAAAGLDREALLLLDRDGVRLTDAGAELVLPSLAGEDLGEATSTQTVALRRAAAVLACPVRALDAWIGGAGPRFGPVFCKVDRWGRLRAAGLRASPVRLLRRDRPGDGHGPRDLRGGRIRPARGACGPAAAPGPCHPDLARCPQVLLGGAGLADLAPPMLERAALRREPAGTRGRWLGADGRQALLVSPPGMPPMTPGVRQRALADARAHLRVWRDVREQVQVLTGQGWEP